MQHLEDFLSRLDGVTRSGSGWKACCPCEKHGNKGIDNKPSLSVSLGDDNKILLFCFAGCSSEDIVADMGLDFRDLWPSAEDQINNTDVPAVVPKAQPSTSGKNPAYHMLEAGFGEPIDADLFHKVYSAMLEKLTLTSVHRENLRKRGLSDEQIDKRGYRSLTFFQFRQAIPSLREPFGEALSSVPGFKTNTEDVTAVKMPNGIVIPIRDVEGRIIALLIRADNDNQPSKYLWFPLDNTHILLILERSHFAHWPQHNNRSVVLTAEQVKDYNTLQVMRSSQRVFCANDDFDLAREVCKAHPKVCDPNRPRVVVEMTPIKEMTNHIIVTALE